MVEDACRLSPLTSEREQQLATIIEAAPRDPHGIPCGPEAVAAMHELVEHNTRFAVSEGRNYAGKNKGRISSDETSSAALLGLCVAATKIKPLGCRFASHARNYIRNEIRNAIRNTVGATSIPTSAFDSLSKVTRLRSAMSYDDPHYNDHKYIARAAGVKVHHAMASIALTQAKVSLNAPVKEGGTVEHGDLLSGLGYGDMYTFADRVDVRSRIARLLDGAPPRTMRAIVDYYYGERTMEEIAVDMGCTPQNVSRLIVLEFMRARRRERIRLLREGQKGWRGGP